MANTTYTTTQDMINKLQQSKNKTKLKFYKNITVHYYEMNIKRRCANFQFQEDPFSKNVQGISKIYHEVLLVKKFFQTKPQVKNMTIICQDLYCTVIKNRDDKETVDDKYEIDYINFNDFITPNYYIGKNDEVTLR